MPDARRADSNACNGMGGTGSAGSAAVRSGSPGTRKRGGRGPRPVLLAVLILVFSGTLAALILAVGSLLAGCWGGGLGAGLADDGTTSGPPYEEPRTVLTATFDESQAERFASASIDVSTASQGYVGVCATAASRLKFQVRTVNMTYNYDLPDDGTPLIVPLNMGDGIYTFRVMQNTTGSNYVEIASTSVDVVLANEFEPYLHPNAFCNYTPDSPCVTQAFQLATAAENQGDVVRAIYSWLVGSIAYDDEKAAVLVDATGYLPDPDETVATGKGICFDYASLAAAMFRSLGIPCQIITGYVSPDDIYHAWNMIYIDGEWVSARISIVPDQWNRIDVTFAATSGSQTVGDGQTYTDRYVY